MIHFWFTCIGFVRPVLNKIVYGLPNCSASQTTKRWEPLVKMIIDPFSSIATCGDWQHPLSRMWQHKLFWVEFVNWESSYLQTHFLYQLGTIIASIIMFILETFCLYLTPPSPSCVTFGDIFGCVKFRPSMIQSLLRTNSSITSWCANILNGSKKLDRLTNIFLIWKTVYFFGNVTIIKCWWN